MHLSTLQKGVIPDKQEKFFLHLVVFCIISSSILRFIVKNVFFTNFSVSYPYEVIWNPYICQKNML